MKNFLRQIKFEIKNILMSKFLLIIGILVLLLSIVIPVIGVLSRSSNQNSIPGPIIYGEPMRYDYIYKDSYYPGYPGGGGDSITIDGIVIDPSNPFFWNLSSLLQNKNAVEQGGMAFTHPESANLAIDMYDAQIEFYMHYVKAGITDYTDYRINLQSGINRLFDKLIYEHNDINAEALYEAAMFSGISYYDQNAFNTKYVQITSEQRLAALDAVDEYLGKLYDVIDSGNFPLFIEISKLEQQAVIKSNDDLIAIYQQQIIDNPEQEQNLSMQIDQLRKQNKYIEEYQIPMLQYRLDKNIIPGLVIWQNTAIYDIEDAENWLMYNEIFTEEQFNDPQNSYLKEQYGSYSRYLAQMTAQKNAYVDKELVAWKCLDEEKPDMKYVPDGARSITFQFLSYSIFVAIFAVLLGGWIMASEFQLGTIRLLLIRPKTRTKILMAKFCAAIIISLAVYLAGCIINIIANGIIFGFSDFAFPNFTVNGEVAFFASYIGAFLACSVTVIFAYCVAFMFSMLTKNIAVSIIIPVVCFIGCYITMALVAYRPYFDWIAYTPIPYVQMSDFFQPQSTPYSYVFSPVQTLLSSGVPLDKTYGIILLLGLSAVCALVSIFAFRKRDIAN